MTAQGEPNGAQPGMAVPLTAHRQRGLGHLQSTGKNACATECAQAGYTQSTYKNACATECTQAGMSTKHSQEWLCHRLIRSKSRGRNACATD